MRCDVLAAAGGLAEFTDVECVWPFDAVGAEDVELVLEVNGGVVRIDKFWTVYG